MSSLRLGFALLLLSSVHGLVQGASISPKLGDGSEVDWWFTYKLNTYAYPNCSTERQCIFGGTVQEYKYGYGMQYLLSSSVGGTTTDMELKTDCLGTGADPVALTFAQIYKGDAPNYVIWNDQFYREPQLNLTPPCSTYSSDPTSCSAPWGHSKGAMAWDANGNGFIMQVTTPDWPGSGSPDSPRPTQGNTLGCIADDNVEVAQHLFSLKLSPSDTKAVLMAMQRASVVTDPSNTQLVKLTDGPSELSDLVKTLGTLDDSTTPYEATLSTGAKLIAKPHALHVPTWQMVSSIVGKGLRTATWWADPAILSAEAGTPGCWSSDLASPEEVQIATSGRWQNANFSLEGGLGQNHNHAKLGYSLAGNLAIMGDMNQQGSYTPELRNCNSSQNGRGGMFFVLDDATLRNGLKDLMTGSTAAYYDNSTNITCGGAGVSSSTCRSSSKADAGCVYVYSADVQACDVTKYGCYNSSTLPSTCPEKSNGTTTCGGAGTSASSCRSSAKVAAGCAYVYSANAAACDVSGYGCYEDSSLPSGCPDKTLVETLV